MILIALLVAMFQGSLLVKYFTKFTKEVFSALVSLLYTYEALKKLAKIYAAHPLEDVQNYCDHSDVENSPKMQPNTALLSTILMFGTFAIAYGLRAVKGSKFFGRMVNTFLRGGLILFIYFFFQLFLGQTYFRRFWSSYCYCYNGTIGYVDSRRLHRKITCT